jgi:A/G-specific adenine glycosylase
MLQQTQVATVLPYFERFVEKVPDVSSLAAIEEVELMRLWEGLGYYRRARSMHAAAKEIETKHGGHFPTTFDEVLALPGIGRYTAGAILSISADQQLPILEGNTQRVFSRLVGLRETPTSSAAMKLLWSFAETMLPKTGSGNFNQAAMELGALVCTPRSPSCDQCPLQSRCVASKLGLQSEIPGKLSKTIYEDRTEFLLVIANREEDRFLVRQIPSGRRWSGLWDFPRTAEQTFTRLDETGDWFEKSEGIRATTGARLTTLKHAVTRYRITLHAHFATLGGKSSRPPRGWTFVEREELTKLPMNVTGRKIVDLLHKSAD